MATITDFAQAAGASYSPATGGLPKNTNRGDGLCIMTWVMLGVATVLVAGRVMSKVLVLHRFRLDDIFLLLTWVSLDCFINRCWRVQSTNCFSRLVLSHMLQAYSLRIIMALVGTQVSSSALSIDRLRWSIDAD